MGSKKKGSIIYAKDRPNNNLKSVADERNSPATAIFPELMPKNTTI
jgi:hypothetical protein